MAVGIDSLGDDVALLMRAFSSRHRQRDEAGIDTSCPVPQSWLTDTRKAAVFLYVAVSSNQRDAVAALLDANNIVARAATSLLEEHLATARDRSQSPATSRRSPDEVHDCPTCVAAVRGYEDILALLLEADGYCSFTPVKLITAALRSPVDERRRLCTTLRDYLSYYIRNALQPLGIDEYFAHEQLLARVLSLSDVGEGEVAWCLRVLLEVKLSPVEKLSSAEKRRHRVKSATLQALFSNVSTAAQDSSDHTVLLLPMLWSRATGGCTPPALSCYHLQLQTLQQFTAVCGDFVGRYGHPLQQPYDGELSPLAFLVSAAPVPTDRQLLRPSVSVQYREELAKRAEMLRVALASGASPNALAYPADVDAAAASTGGSAHSEPPSLLYVALSTGFVDAATLLLGYGAAIGESEAELIMGNAQLRSALLEHYATDELSGFRLDVAELERMLDAAGSRLVCEGDVFHECWDRCRVAADCAEAVHWLEKVLRDAISAPGRCLALCRLSIMHLSVGNPAAAIDYAMRAQAADLWDRRATLVMYLCLEHQHTVLGPLLTELADMLRSIPCVLGGRILPKDPLDAAKEKPSVPDMRPVLVNAPGGRFPMPKCLELTHKGGRSVVVELEGGFPLWVTKPRSCPTASFGVVEGPVAAGFPLDEGDIVFYNRIVEPAPETHSRGMVSEGASERHARRFSHRVVGDHFEFYVPRGDGEVELVMFRKISGVPTGTLIDSTRPLPEPCTSTNSNRRLWGQLLSAMKGGSAAWVRVLPVTTEAMATVLRSDCALRSDSAATEVVDAQLLSALHGSSVALGKVEFPVSHSTFLQAGQLVTFDLATGALLSTHGLVVDEPESTDVEGGEVA